MRKIVFLLITLGWVCVVHGASFEHANTLYKNGQYDSAIQMYQGLLLNEQSDDLFYNLGNAYFKKGKYPLAIYHYEMALRLNPSHQDAAFNLMLANLRVPNGQTQVHQTGILKWANTILNARSIDGWAWLCVCCFIAVPLGWVVLYVLNSLKFKRLTLILIFLSLFSGVFAWGMAAIQYTQFNKLEAILMVDGQGVKSEPKQESTTLFMLSAGAKVSVKDTLDGWANIQFDAEKQGWLPTSAIKVLR